MLLAASHLQLCSLHAVEKAIQRCCWHTGIYLLLIIKQNNHPRIIVSDYISLCYCCHNTGFVYRNCTSEGWSETFPRPDVACGYDVNDTTNEERVSLIYYL